MRGETMDEDSRLYTAEERLERIEQEKAKLRRQFTKLEARTKKVVASLIDNAAFMAVTLEELQDHINTNGAVSQYQNGENQWGTKKSPEVDVYNVMIKNYSTVMKQLADLLPKVDLKAAKKTKGDEFDEFVNDR